MSAYGKVPHRYLVWLRFVLDYYNALIYTVKSLVFILTGDDEDKLVQRSAEVAYYNELV